MRTVMALLARPRANHSLTGVAVVCDLNCFPSCLPQGQVKSIVLGVAKNPDAAGNRSSLTSASLMVPGGPGGGGALTYGGYMGMPGPGPPGMGMMLPGGGGGAPPNNRQLAAWNGGGCGGSWFGRGSGGDGGGGGGTAAYGYGAYTAQQYNDSMA